MFSRDQIVQLRTKTDARASGYADDDVSVLIENASGKEVTDYGRLGTKIECLVIKDQVFGEEAGFLYNGAGKLITDRAALSPVLDALLRRIPALPNGRELTYTCVPPGSGPRSAIDRNGDGHPDGDGRAAGSDPADSQLMDPLVL